MESNLTVSWPNGMRVAVLVSVLLETWSEGKSPTYFPRTTPLKPGMVDLPGRQSGNVSISWKGNPARGPRAG